MTDILYASQEVRSTWALTGLSLRITTTVTTEELL